MNCAFKIQPLLSGDQQKDQDWALIQRVLLFSDQQAFAELMETHQSSIRRMLLRFTKRDLCYVEDLVQETFVRAYLSLAGFDARSRFSTWLYRIAFNLAVDYSRKKIIHVEASDNLENVSGKSLLDNWELSKDLERSMQQLNAKQKTVVLLCLSEGYTHVEAAELMEMPLGTVKTHVTRAKKILQQEMIHWRSLA